MRLRIDMITNQCNWSGSFGLVVTFLISDQMTQVHWLFTGSSLRYDFDEMVGTVPLTLHIISSDDLALWEVQVDKVASEDKT